MGRIIGQSFYDHEGNLLYALLMVIILLVFADAVGQVSLGLVAISYLMWVTLPWEFLDDIAKELKEAEQNERKDEMTEKLRCAFFCLESAINEYLISGLFFFSSVIVWLGVLTRASNVAGAQPMTLLVGGVFLGLALVDTYFFIDYKFHPQHRADPLLRRLRLSTSMSSLLTFAGFILNVILFFYMIPLQSTILHRSSSFLLFSSVAGWFAALVLYGAGSRELPYRSLVRGALIFVIASPWGFWLIFTIGRGFGRW